MDVAREAQLLRLDMLAVRVSRTLTAAGVPHALIKGHTTAAWLYDPPRPYLDVDLLVPRSRARAAERALRGQLHRVGGGIGEEAPHSLALAAPGNYEVDLHVSLPLVPPRGDAVWTALAGHVAPHDLAVGTVPALDPAGRCLVLTLVALANAGSGREREDLARARRVAGAPAWAAATGLAARLGVGDLFAAGLSLVEPGGPPATPRAALYLSGPSPAALGLQRLRDARARDLPRLLARELYPSRGFVALAHPETAGHPLRAGRARVRRLARIAGQVSRRRRPCTGR